MKICSNCGGSFNEKESKCPYCGALNAEGAEKEYMEKLNKVRKNLDNVDEEAVKAYKGELKTFFTVFLITLLIAGFIGVIVVNKGKETIERIESYDKTPVDVTIAKMASFHEATEKWNALYDSEDYEGFVSAVDAEKTNYPDMMFYWKHNRFYMMYKDLLVAEDSYQTFLEKEEHSEYEYTTFLNDVLFSYYQLNYSPDSQTLSMEEKLLIEEKLNLLVSNVNDTLGMSDADFEALRIRSGGNSFPSYVEVSNFVKERWFE